MKLDAGCGDQRKEGFFGIDRLDFGHMYPDGQFKQHDLKDPLPFETDSVDQIWCHHVFEHLPQLHPTQGMDFEIWVMNEFWRVLKPGCELHVIVPWIEHPNARRCPAHYRMYDLWSFQWYTYGERMWAEIIANGRRGRWTAIRPTWVQDETHIYALMTPAQPIPGEVP